MLLIMKMKTSDSKPEIERTFKGNQINDGSGDDGHQNDDNNIHSCMENGTTRQQTSGGCLKCLDSCK